MKFIFIILTIFAVSFPTIAEVASPHVIQLKAKTKIPLNQTSYSKHQACVADLLQTQQFCLSHKNVGKGCSGKGKSVTIWHERINNEDVNLFTLTDSGLSKTHFPVRERSENPKDVEPLRAKIPSEIPGGFYLWLVYHSPMLNFKNSSLQFDLATKSSSPTTNYTSVDLNNLVSPSDAQNAISRLVVRKLQDYYYAVERTGGELSEEFKETLCSCMLNDDEIKKAIEKFHEFNWSSLQCLVS